MCVRATSGNSTTPIQARVEEGESIRTHSEIVTHEVARSSHPFTGWTSLVTLSEYDPAEHYLVTANTRFCSPFREVLNCFTLGNACTCIVRCQIPCEGRTAHGHSYESISTIFRIPSKISIKGAEESVLACGPCEHLVLILCAMTIRQLPKNGQQVPTRAFSWSEP